VFSRASSPPDSRRRDGQGSREEQLDYVAEHLLSRAAILVRLLVKQVRGKDINRTELQVLAILQEGPRTITELTDLEGTAQPTMTSLVKRLEEKGWVARRSVPHDGRVAMISLTGGGEVALEGFRAQFLAALRVDLGPLSDERLRELAEATETLSSFVEELQRRARA
jgi:DNA-binding MarR family transcriptional regulator